MASLARAARFLCALVLGPSIASAARLVSNMANTTAANLSPQSNFWMAQQFTTDSSAWIVSSIQFRGARNALQTLAVSIYSDNGANLPLASVGTLDASGVTTVVRPQVLPAIGTSTLAASTAYWIVLAPSTLDTALWTRTTDLTATGTGTIPNAKATRPTAAPPGARWSTRRST
jgi:hypothetical protein